MSRRGGIVHVHLDPDPASQIDADPDPDPKPLCNEQERREFQLAVPYYRMSQLPPLAVLERLELSTPPLNPGIRPPLTSLDISHPCGQCFVSVFI
jgi:hypothetical protein